MKWRQKVFPLLTMLMALLIVLLFSYKYLKFEPFQILLFITVIALMLHLSPPFIAEMKRINSLSLTFGLFIGVGLILRKHPMIAIFCIALSANFRLVNLLMLLPILIFLFPKMWEMVKNRNWESFLMFTSKNLLSLVVGISPYLYYTYNLLGTPFKLTYPLQDTSFGSMTGVYFGLDKDWYVVHLIVIIVLVFLKWMNKLSFKELIIWILFPLINYLFFSFHKIQMSYYPFASFFILLGAVIYYLPKEKINKLNSKITIIIPLIIAIGLCIDGIGRYLRKDHVSFEETISYYQPLCNFDVVWGEQFNSTSEYVCVNSGFKYDYGSRKAREITLKYLEGNDYSQVILCDDVKMDIEGIKNELNSFGIKFSIQNLPQIGKIIVIN